MSRPSADYVSRRVMDRYHDKFTRRQVAMTNRINSLREALVKLTMDMDKIMERTMESKDSFNYCHECGRLAHLEDCEQR